MDMSQSIVISKLVRMLWKTMFKNEYIIEIIVVEKYLYCHYLLKKSL